MIRVSQIKLPIGHTEQELVRKLAKELHSKEQEILSYTIAKRSLDARKKPQLFYLYQVEVKVKHEAQVQRVMSKQCSVITQLHYEVPCLENNPFSKPPVIVGAGPAGLFCAYLFSLCHIPCVVIERGEPIEERVKTIDLFWETGRLSPQSNVQFGEGGAGTFSDGKLNTLVKDKTGKQKFVLETFVQFGAPKEILYEAKPHIGTDLLRVVIRNMREAMEANGVTFLFNHQLTDVVVKEQALSAVVINGETTLETNQVCLAIGHSARDTFAQLMERNIQMEAKAFAVGLRVEHPRAFIDFTQYGVTDCSRLSAASYKLTAKTSKGRGVYTFCMCPGGYVVNASSEPERLAINGMSYSGRNGDNSNSAVIVTVTPEDFPSKDPLAGIAFQRKLEERAYRIGAGKVPVERFGDFSRAVLDLEKTNTPNAAFGEYEPTSAWADFSPRIKGGYVYGKVHEILPEELNLALVEGMAQFGKQLPGFDGKDCLLSGVESRTSSPVRIPRDETGCCVSLKGLYPCGEGAGYAGGIMSAAMDGLTIAEKMLKHQ